MVCKNVTPQKSEIVSENYSTLDTMGQLNILHLDVVATHTANDYLSLVVVENPPKTQKNFRVLDNIGKMHYGYIMQNGQVKVLGDAGEKRSYTVDISFFSN